MTSQQKLLQLIKASNPLASGLQPASVTFGVPTALANETFNTSVTVTATPVSGFTGTVTVKYNRRDLADLEPTSSFGFDSTITVESVLAKLNQAWLTTLAPEDLQPVNIPPMIPGLVNHITLKAAASSLLWIGELEVEIIRLNTEQDKIDQLVQAVAGVQQEVDILEDMLGVGDDNVSVLMQARKFNNTTDDFFLGQPVYAIGVNGMGLARANAEATAVVIGLVASTLVESGGGEGKIQSIGVLTGSLAQWDFATGMIGGLAPNQPYFLDPDVKGRITPFRPMQEGQYLTYIGTAISPTQLSINIDRPITL